MPRLSTTKDHKLRIRLPWKRRMWSINDDNLRLGHPTLIVGWYCEFGCFFFRLGWTIDA
jgi:hypothetical protein